MENAQNHCVICKYCNESVSPGFKRCPFCGSLLETDTFEKERVDTAQDEISMDEAAGRTQGLDTGDNTNIHNRDKAGKTKTKNDLSSQKKNTNTSSGEIKMLGNGIKVFLVTITNLLPGIGQLLGVIIGIALMGGAKNPDKRSFGKAIFVSSLFVFVFMLILFSLLAVYYA
ncbi:MAG: hypothetical protein GX992_06540 [Clostridium sp.]|nr:hypothetical protein [Clostridium sp.]